MLHRGQIYGCEVNAFTLVYRKTREPLWVVSPKEVVATQLHWNLGRRLHLTLPTPSR